MSAIISIPAPCNEDWNMMTPQAQGRHCDVCAKTVVDFTAWQPQEILFYMQKNASGKVCGRFLSDQLNEPIPTPEDFVRQLHHFAVPFLKKAAAILLFAFSAMMISCNDNNAERLSGKVPTQNYADTSPKQLSGDTVAMPIKTGEPAVNKQPVKKIKPKMCDPDILGVVAMTPETPLTGLIAVDRIPPITDTTHTINAVTGVDKPKEEVIMGKMIAGPAKNTNTNKKRINSRMIRSTLTYAYVIK